MDTPYELYFLRGELPREIAGGYRWSLMAIKIHDHGAYLAFGTSALAELAVQYFESQTVAATSALDDQHYYDFAHMPVVLFDAKSDVEQWLANRGHYPLEQHLQQYSPDHGLSKVVV